MIFGLFIAMVVSFGLGIFVGWMVAQPDTTTTKRKNKMKDW